LNFNGDKTGNGLSWEMIATEMSKFGNIHEGDIFKVVRRKDQDGKIMLEFKRVE